MTEKLCSWKKWLGRITSCHGWASMKGSSFPMASREADCPTRNKNGVLDGEEMEIYQERGDRVIYQGTSWSKVIRDRETFPIYGEGNGKEVIE